MDCSRFEKTKLRTLIRQKRRQLPLEAQQEMANELTNIITQHALFHQCQNIAAYCPYEGEINPHAILLKALDTGKRVFLPALTPNAQTLRFLEYKMGDPLSPNRFGILEPHSLPEKVIDPSLLQLVLLPLVAFDKTGQRLGTGSGYYDKTFAFLSQKPRPKEPYLVGLAYEFQEVEKLPLDHWDIPLCGIATEKRFIEIRNEK